MKRILTVLILLLAGLAGRGQTVSMDFTRNDCNGTEHHLYQELNDGRVVVLEYIMLGCSSCILASEQVRDLLAPFETTHPGRARQYIFGFIKNYTCSQLNSWQTENGLAGTIFEDGSSQVGYYGGMGMPTIVVTAGNTHQVLYKKLGFEPSDTTAIIAAIQTGLQYNPQSIGDDLRAKGVKIYPTVFTDQFSVSLPSTLSGSLELYNVLGRQVASKEFSATASFSMGGLNLDSGIYLVVIRTADGILGSMKVICQ
jgi:hypothetical protein